MKMATSPTSRHNAVFPRVMRKLLCTGMQTRKEFTGEANRRKKQNYRTIENGNYLAYMGEPVVGVTQK